MTKYYKDFEYEYVDGLPHSYQDNAYKPFNEEMCKNAVYDITVDTGIFDFNEYAAVEQCVGSVSLFSFWLEDILPVGPPNSYFLFQPKRDFIYY